MALERTPHRRCFSLFPVSSGVGRRSVFLDDFRGLLTPIPTFQHPSGEKKHCRGAGGWSVPTAEALCTGTLSPETHGSRLKEWLGGSHSHQGVQPGQHHEKAGALPEGMKHWTLTSLRSGMVGAIYLIGKSPFKASLLADIAR